MIYKEIIEEYISLYFDEYGELLTYEKAEVECSLLFAGLDSICNSETDPSSEKLN